MRCWQLTGSVGLDWSASVGFIVRPTPDELAAGAIEVMRLLRYQQGVYWLNEPIEWSCDNYGYLWDLLPEYPKPEKIIRQSRGDTAGAAALGFFIGASL